MSDKTIHCKDCNKDFLFTSREQAFYEQNDFTEPKRCKACRDAKKSRQDTHSPRPRRAS